MNNCSYRLLPFVFLVGCGAGNSGDDTQADAPPQQHLDATKCTAFAQSVATAASTCGTPLPGGAQASIEGWCKKGVTVASACGGNPAGLDCFASPDPTDWVCQLGQPYRNRARVRGCRRRS